MRRTLETQKGGRVGSRDDLKSELSTLVKDGTVLLAALVKGDDADFLFPYQDWYTKSLAAVRALAPDRLEEFRRYYEPDPKRKGLGYGTYVIQDYVKGVAPLPLAYSDFDTRDQAARGFMSQISILASINSRIDSVLADIEAHLQTDVQSAELATASELVKINPRAAGALAGVILERHLQTVAGAHAVSLGRKKPTIANLNDPLKHSGAYDIATWRKISYLGDLRNLCSHNKTSEPTAAQARELIDGVNWAIKTIF
jgi:hypothetical protein